MSQKEIYIAQLIVRFLNNELNEIEKQELYSWLEGPHHQKLFDKVTNKENLLNKTFEYDRFDPKTVWSKIDKRTRKPALYRTWIKYAAAILIPVAIGFLGVRQISKVHKKLITKETKIIPGETNAIIYFANGEVVDLKKDTSSLIQSKENLIVKRDSNQLQVDTRKLIAKHSVRMNKIVTPRGGEHQLILPDGTKVWLNADSYLEFPSKFTGKERNVKAGGELYFEVASNKNFPFVVESNDMRLRVVGTEFNLRAYDNENHAISTLVEGKVEIENIKGNKIQLCPGYEVILNRFNTEMELREANLEMATAWKNGRFYYDNMDLGRIMEDVGRWYDAEIFYWNSNIKKEHFFVDVPRYGNIEEILKLLKETGIVSFEITDKTILVK